MRKPMTKKQCYQICASMWRWMAKTKAASTKQKRNWPGLSKCKLAFNCAACEWVEQHIGTLICKHCPLLSLWTNNEGYNTAFCMVSSTSPYRSFVNKRGTPEDAMRIVRFCEQKLKELKKEEVNA